MARGNHLPFTSFWFKSGVGASPPQRNRRLDLWRKIHNESDGTVHANVWSNFFFEASGIAHPLTGKLSSLLTGKFG